MAVNKSGRNVSYNPPGDLKSGIPDATLTPAPVKVQIDRHFGCKMYSARLFISTIRGSSSFFSSSSRTVPFFVVEDDDDDDDLDVDMAIVIVNTEEGKGEGHRALAMSRKLLVDRSNDNVDGRRNVMQSFRSVSSTILGND